MAFVAFSGSFSCLCLVIIRHPSKRNPSNWLWTFRFMHVQYAVCKGRVSTLISTHYVYTLLHITTLYNEFITTQKKLDYTQTYGIGDVGSNVLDVKHHLPQSRYQAQLQHQSEKMTQTQGQSLPSQISWTLPDLVPFQRCGTVFLQEWDLQEFEQRSHTGRWNRIWACWFHPALQKHNILLHITT